MGTQQSGIMDFNIADIVKDKEILIKSREEANYIFENDPTLEHEKLAIVKAHLSSIMRKKPNWGRIS